MKRLCPLFAALLLLTPGFAADEMKLWNIRIEMQVVAIPDEIAVPLVAEMMDEKKIETAYVTIQDLLAKGTAKLIGWPLVTTRSGEKAVVEAVDEIRYATEYDAPAVSFTPGVNATETVKIEPKVDVTVFAGIPATFETRNTGVTLEVEPTLSSDAKTIALSLVPQHVRLKGYNKVAVEKSATGEKVVVEQPEFDTMKVTTSLTLRNGQRMLMGVFRVSDPAKHIEFFILKAEARIVE